MKKSLLHILVMFALFIAGCGYNRFYFDDAGNVRPRKPRFKLKGALENYQGEFLVDTNAVYLRTLYNVYAGPYRYDTLYSFMRFFPEGQYFHSKGIERMPSKNEYAELKNGYTGYYAFKEGEVLIETFNQVEFGTYFLSKLRLQNDTLLIEYKQKVNCWHCHWSRVNLIYRKIPVENLDGKPDW